METIGLYDAMARMRMLTEAGVPFSIEYCSCNTTDRTSKGIKKVEKVLLRTGLSADISTKSEILIGYSEQPNNESKWFYLPLLLKFNGIKVVP